MLHDDDHRALGHRLGLFHLQEEAAGSVFWHPRGLQLLRALEEHIRRVVLRQGYREVRSPQVLAQPIWERSGHWTVFRQGMLVVEGEGRALKPVSCPGHMELVRRMAPLASELPLRIAELGLVHRDEPSGALHGLFRLRQFSQDDGHVFCREDQVAGEVVLFVRSLRALYSALGFDQVQVAFSGRPPNRLGGDAVWDRAEALLAQAAGAAGLAWSQQPGEGAFYGPKLEFILRDRLGRAWQCGTIQVDLVLPERFELAFPDGAGERHRPVVLHRALLGSLERFLGILLEHHRGRLPAWLAPEQVVVASLEGGGAGHARNACRILEQAGVRVRLDGRAAALSRKVADAHRLAVPYLVAAGPRDEAKGSVGVRDAIGARRDVQLDSLGAELGRLCAPPPIEGE
ncbi:MAG TPA: threonine--tRNA ligase [Myxococcaceae bacterium]|nr:threonine--tRNA ligase [Myxococcaceae bacterium]